jgi:hypothetical protein
MKKSENIVQLKKNNNFPDIFTTKEKYYYKMVNNYFKEVNINKMIKIVNGKSKISLRILDWFVTSYAKKRKTCYEMDSNGDKDNFNVHINYKAQLKSYTKRYFDPFRRKKKFIYTYKDNNEKKQINTTIGQMNFFRWAISNKIIYYVDKNYVKIVKEMNKANKENKKIKEKKSKQKIKMNKNLIKKPNIKVSTKKDENNVDIIISFE